MQFSFTTEDIFHKLIEAAGKNVKKRHTERMMFFAILHFLNFKSET